MPTYEYQAWVFNKKPTGKAITHDGSDKAVVKYEKRVLTDDLKPGQILVKTVYASNDPLQLVWFDHPEGFDFGGQMAQGEEVRAVIHGKVIASANDSIKPGAYIDGYGSWSEYKILDGNSLAAFGGSVIDTERFPVAEVPLLLHATLLSLASLTAAAGLWSNLKFDETDEKYRNKVHLVTTAAGGVGSFFVQATSKVFKAKAVYAVTGSDEKVKYVESLGPNIIGLNYKDPDFGQKLASAVEHNGKIDYFYDQAGGQIFRTVLPHVNHFGTVLHTGSMSSKQFQDAFTGEEEKFYTFHDILHKNLTVKGNLLNDFLGDFPNIKEKIVKYYKEGLLEIAADLTDCKGDKFKLIPEKFEGLLRGKNIGKSLVQVGDE